MELAQNVKLVAKLLSEKVHVSQEKPLAAHQHLDPNFIYHISKFKASNGSLSDSGISDGGATSDGGLSERERRLGVLRRLAKQLELALAPGSEAMRSIAIQMENAEAELKYLQNTCRDLIVRTAATHHERQQSPSQQKELQHPKANEKVHKKETVNNTQASTPGKRPKNSRKPHKSKGLGEGPVKAQNHSEKENTAVGNVINNTNCASEGDSTDDQSLLINLESSKDDDDTESNPSGSLPRGWAWRIARAAVPMQVALFTIFCAACLMQPNCCDNLNNLSMSFTPQLRYIRGPPPMWGWTSDYLAGTNWEPFLV